MNIRYNLSENYYNYEQLDKLELSKLNFVLTNNKGDFLNCGVQKNSSKFQGLNICNPKTLEIFKFLDEITIGNLEVDQVIYEGYKITRKYKSLVLESSYEDKKNITTDSFYLSPVGALVYEINNFDGNLTIDLDMRKLNDFSKWGREYKVYRHEGILFVEYTKKNENQEQYNLYLGIKAPNFAYDLIEKWVEKEYSYSKNRNSESNLFIYRLMRVNILESKKIIFGCAFSQKEVINQLNLLENHTDELINFDKNIFNDITTDTEFKKPLTQDINLAYKLSSNSVYNFLNNSLEFNNKKIGSFAGLPWFSQIWTRDELVGLRSLINLDEQRIVKQKIFDYLNSIDSQTGMIRKINDGKCDFSPDGLFWLAKRVEDFIFYLEKKGNLKKVLSDFDLKLIHEKLSSAFVKLIQNYWDSENELLKVKPADSWMDTVDTFYPLDIQVQLLEFVSVLGIISSMLNLKEQVTHYLDFENLLREKIRETYLRNGLLYEEPTGDRLTSNLFLAYYFYPDLFLKSDWEDIIDKSLPLLKTEWGGISSLSNTSSNFQENYTGENNISYHNGDSWFWINNICTIALEDLNEKKYRKTISNILLSSTKDILKMGTIGFASEISSASTQRSEGCMAQLWSSSTYIEMIDKLFEKK